MSGLNQSIPLGQVRSLGDAGLIVGMGDARSASSLAHAIEEAGWDGVTDVVVGLASAAVMVDPMVRDPAELVFALQQLAADVDDWDPYDHAGPEIVVETVFDGDDLGQVADLSGLSIDEVVKRFVGSRFTVAMVGFSPGFGYLQGLDSSLASVARQLTPRAKVPAGAVALAGGFAAIYPQSTPGGWQIIGQTSATMFDPNVAPYSRLKAGDRVRFVAHPSSEPIVQLTTTKASDRRVTDRGFSSDLVVVEPGLSTSVQDAGRRGLGAIGVPTAGPADSLSHELANALVGNAPDTSAIEMTALGPTIEFAVEAHIAVVGALTTVTLDGRRVDQDRVVPVTAGQRLAVGHVTRGLRCYLAAAGGVQCERVMGSTSTDALTGLGPGLLSRGDELGIGASHGVLRDHLEGWSPLAGWDDDVVELRIVAGPHPEQFDHGALTQLTSTAFVVGPTSDRVGLRLTALAPEVGPLIPTGQIESQAMVHGAIQVPPDGQPVVLGCDHGTSGGYPVVAVVISADLWRLGQMAPGSHVRFRLVDHETARHELGLLRGHIDRSVAGHYPTSAG